MLRPDTAHAAQDRRARAAGDATSRAVAILAAKPVAEDIQAGLKHVIPKGLRLAQQDLHRQEAGKRDYPWLADAHWTPALRLIEVNSSLSLMALPYLDGPSRRRAAPRVADRHSQCL